MKTQTKTNGSIADGVNATLAASRKAASDARSGLTREFHSLVSDLEDLIKSTSASTRDELDNTRSMISARVASARKSAAEALKDTMEDVEDFGGAMAGRARQTAKVTNRYVHKQPWRVIGIGAAVGLLIGIALSARRR